MVTQDYLQKRYFVNSKTTKVVGISNVSIDRYEASILDSRKALVLKGREITLGSIGPLAERLKRMIRQLRYVTT